MKKMSIVNANCNKSLVGKVYKTKLVKKCILNPKELVKIAEDSMMRAVLGKSMTKKYIKDTKTIINRQSHLDDIPFSDRFNHYIDKDLMSELIQKYRTENNIVEFKDIEYIKNGVKFTKNEKDRQIFLYSINDNMKNACYCWIYENIAKVKKYLAIKKILRQKTQKLTKRTIEWYQKMSTDKRFNNFLSNIMYIDIKGNKEFKIFKCYTSFAMNFDKLMYLAYYEKSNRQYNWETSYKHDMVSIYDEESETGVIQIADVVDGYDNLATWLDLMKELSETEKNILLDIAKGHKYTELQIKYQVSSKTIAKIKDKVLKLLSPNVDKKTKKVENKENDKISKGILERKQKEVDGLKEVSYFNWKEYKNDKLTVKEVYNDKKDYRKVVNEE